MMTDDMKDMVECPNCGGTGEDTCAYCDSDIECEECGGTGEVEDEPSPG